jgi:hypothetical protein
MDSRNVKAKVKRERRFHPYGELRHANWVLLENAREKRDGCLYECMTAILMSAFKFEAFLNEVGDRLFPFWSEMERLPHRRKLAILRSHLGMETGDGERPYQTLRALFRFRNALAHAKPEMLDPPECEEVGEIEELRRKKPLTEWEQRCTLEFAERAFRDTEAISDDILEKAGIDGIEFRSCGHSYSIGDVTELT